MDEMEAFRRGRLAAGEVESIAAHLRECHECGTRWPSVDAAAAALFADLSSEEHPEVDDLFAYVDGSLPRERANEIAEHLRGCTQCSEDVADAQRVGQRQPERLSYVLAAAAAIVVVVGGAAFWLGHRPAPAPAPQPGRVIHVTPPAQTHSPWQSIIDDARRAGGVPIPAIIRELRGAPDAFRGERESVQSMRLWPAGTVVKSTRPEFTWRAKKPGRYVVSVVCNDKLVAKSEPVSGDRWTPVHPLPRGTVCMWQLERLTDHEIFPAPPAPQPAFRVLDEPTLATIEKAESEQPRDELAVGLLYARAGVQQDAEEHLRNYVETHPDDHTAPHILQSIEGW